MNKATYNGQAVAKRRDGTVIEKRDLGGSVETKLPLGNARAKAGQTKGFKHWVGTKDGGITTEATVTVLVTCGQSMKAITDAADTCGAIAEEIALQHINSMDDHIRDFMRALEGGK